MTRDELLAKLQDIKARQEGKLDPSSPHYRIQEDEETWHAEADDALTDYLRRTDDELAAVYASIDKWYA